MEKVLTTHSAEETQKIARQLAKKITFPQVLALYGDLGSGKTTFVQGLAKGLGIKQNLVSPTFIIHRLYPLPEGKKFHHLDLYRVEKGSNLEFLGLDELFSDSDNLVVIEWPEKIERYLPKNTLKIHFEHLEEETRQLSGLDF